MSYKIIPTHRFEKELKRLIKKFPSLKQDFSGLIGMLVKNPKTGTLIGNSCYKIRLAISSKGKGKSGGARVITYLYLKKEIVYLLTMYDKGEMENLQPNELKQMINSLDLEA
jgi:mRNA-degrading endonuclease RelE of RelBE toxin-antitoxin system